MGGSVEQRVCRAAQRCHLPGVRHHAGVQERAAGAEACDGAALPPVLGPPVEDRPPHELRSKIFGGVRSTVTPAGGSGGDPAAAAAGGGARRGRELPVAHSKAAMASSQLVRLTSCSHV